jgi:hypothetical protein
MSKSKKSSKKRKASRKRRAGRKRKDEIGMKLITKDIANKLLPYSSMKEWKSVDEIIAHAHYWLGGFDWYLVAGSPVKVNDDGTWHFTKDEDDASDWLLHVKGFSHMCPKGEYGDMFLSELKQYSIGNYIKVEREIGWESRPIEECS